MVLSVLTFAGSLGRCLNIQPNFGEGENEIELVLGGHFYAILGPVLSSMYKIQNGDG